MSVFDHLQPINPSGITKVMQKYNADTSKEKIDLASGGKLQLNAVAIFCNE